MKTPDFWYRPPGALATVLAPVGALYGFATRRRLARGVRRRVGVPVICVGNLTAGGTGKTPTVIALAQRLAARGVSAHAVTRGHGGRIEGPLAVDPTRHTASDTGDEALLLAAFLPTWVAKDRAAGAEAAQRSGAQVVLLDDGFQNPGLAQDLALLVADARRGFGNGRMIPAGPLREPIARGMARADALLTIGPDDDQDRFTATWSEVTSVPRLQGRLAPLPTGLPLRGMPTLAFAGIGDPAKFFHTLRALGADLRVTHALADHQPLSDALMARLAREAAKLGAQMVTTEKDAVRLSPSWRPKVTTVPVRLEIDDWTALDALLDRALAAPG